MKKNKKVYLENGQSAYILGEFVKNGVKKYVVDVVGYDDEPYPAGEEIVHEIYEKYEDTPYFKYHQRVDELYKKINELESKKQELEKEINSYFNPKLKIGDVLWRVEYDGKVKEFIVKKISFNLTKETSIHRYYDCFEDWIVDEDINKNVFFSENEARKLSLEIMKKREEEEKQEKLKQEIIRKATEKALEEARVKGLLKI